MTTNTDVAMPELPDTDANYWVPTEESGLLKSNAGFSSNTGPCPDWHVTKYYTSDQMREYARAAIRQAAGAVPEGWKLVPIEPTVEMTRAAAPWLKHIAMMRAIDRTNAIHDAFKAMLNAAPIPPACVSQNTKSETQTILTRTDETKQQPVHLGWGEVGGVPQWQPIETAPRDGAEVLGFRGDAGVFVMRWIAPVDFLTERELADPHGEDRDWQEEPDWFYADFIQGGRLDGTEAPTHWMPLPPPPAPRNDAPTGQINQPASAGQGMEGGDHV